MFTVLALFTQFLFLFSEIIQMRVKGTSVKDYFGEVWNWNDILCLPVYFALQISIWVGSCFQSEQDRWGWGRDLYDIVRNVLESDVHGGLYPNIHQNHVLGEDLRRSWIHDQNILANHQRFKTFLLLLGGL
jgi:hypothetical protein